jgi:hypothetical protein
MRDMLRAVGVPRGDLEQDHLLGPRLVALRHQRFGQCRIIIHHPRLAPYLDPAAVGVIHQEDVGLRVFRKVSLADVLPVAAVIGERQGVLVQDPDKTSRAATVLDIGLAIGAGGGEIQAVRVRQKRGQVVVDLGAPSAVLFDMRIGLTRSLAGLDFLHRRGERDIAGIGLNV